MRRALQSTHYLFAEESFNAVLEGYAEAVGEVEAKKVLEKIREIELRGRYIAERRKEE